MASIPRSRERRNVWLATVRFDTHSGLNSDITARPKSADTVAKVFSGQQTKIIKSVDAFRSVKLKAVAQTWTNGRPRHREWIAARSIAGAQTTLFQLEISSGRGRQSGNHIDEGWETSS